MIREEKAELKLETNRAVIYKALTDPWFRKILKEDPKKALGLEKFTDVNKKEIQKIFEALEEIETRVGRLADSLLCAGNGPCGIG